jgi:hypothetical protein
LDIAEKRGTLKTTKGAKFIFRLASNIGSYRE